MVGRLNAKASNDPLVVEGKVLRGYGGDSFFRTCDVSVFFLGLKNIEYSEMDWNLRTKDRNGIVPIFIGAVGVDQPE